MKIPYLFKIASRSLRSQKWNSAINLVGLSIGFACFSLFLLYANNELHYDDFHSNKDNIFRIYEHTEPAGMGGPRSDAGLYLPLGPALKADVPDVEDYARIFNSWDESFIKGVNNTIHTNITYVDPQFLEIFSFRILHGNKATALNGYKSAVLTNETALQLFGKGDALGKVIQIKVEDKFEPFNVSGIIEDPPSNSSIKFSILLNIGYFQSTATGKAAANNWQFSGFETFILAKKVTHFYPSQNLMASFRTRYFPDEKSMLLQAGMWNGKDPYPINFRFQPLQDIHTSSSISANGHAGVNPSYIWILFGIAAIILAIVSINFITLSLGFSTGRAKEIFVRKVAGSNRRKLITQFLTETLILSFVSGVVGLLIAVLLLPVLNSMADVNIKIVSLLQPRLILLLLAAIAITALLAGSYPALVLSAYKPVDLAKNKLRVSGNHVFGKMLVTFQFTISVVIIVTTVIILRQISFMRSKDLGFEKENVVVIDAAGTDARKIFPLLKQAILSNSQIAGVSCAELGLGEEGYNSRGFEFNGQHQQVSDCQVGRDYLSVMGIKLVAGRNFDTRLVADTLNSAIVNEQLVKDLVLTNEKILGLKLAGLTANPNKTPMVIGVVRNFNYLSLRQSVSALLIRQPADLIPAKIFVRLKPGNPSHSLAYLADSWSKIVADIPFQYNFLDDKLDAFYKTEMKWGSILLSAGTIAICLACLGLLGLTSLATVKRRKEIAIRKVLGASVQGVVLLLSREFLVLISLAVVIGSPVSWFFGNRWLQNYSYRTEVGWWIFVAGGLVILLVSFATLSFHTVKAANSNPAKILKIE